VELLANFKNHLELGMYNSKNNFELGRYNSKYHLGARYLSLELLANSKNHLELGITPKIMTKLGV
jgi:hypothetical protein